MRKYDFTLDLTTPNSNSLILQSVRPNSKVLEFGPAHGRMTKYLKENLHCAVTIVELDTESGSEASKYAARALIGPVDGDIERGPWSQQLSGNTYDHIIFADVLEHLRNPSAVLAAAKDHLSVDGSILISVPNICHNSILLELWQNRFAYRSTGLLDETHVHFFSKASLARIVHQNGLYAVVQHNARNMVENTEFRHSLSELPAAVATAMAKREDADIYHFVWELKRAPWTSPIHNPKISVLLPTYNYGRYLPEAIESVLAQDLPDFELIISDDASTDDSASIIRSYAAKDSRIKACTHEKNLGMVANWNWCLRQARGEYIKYLFGDDRLAVPHALRTLAALLDRKPRIAIAASARKIIDSDGRTVDCWNIIGKPGVHSAAEIGRRCIYTIENCIGEPTAVMFRASLAKERGFDESYKQVVDLEMWLYLLQHGDLAYAENSLCEFRCHSEQQTAVNKKDHTGFIEHKRLFETYAAYFRPSKISLSQRYHLCRFVYYLKKTKNLPDPIRGLTPIFQAELGDASYNLFCILRKALRPFENAHRAWNKYILRRPEYWRRTSE